MKITPFSCNVLQLNLHRRKILETINYKLDLEEQNTGILWKNNEGTNCLKHLTKLNAITSLLSLTLQEAILGHSEPGYLQLLQGVTSLQLSSSVSPPAGHAGKQHSANTKAFEANDSHRGTSTGH